MEPDWPDAMVIRTTANHESPVPGRLAPTVTASQRVATREGATATFRARVAESERRTRPDEREESLRRPPIQNPHAAVPMPRAAPAPQSGNLVSAVVASSVTSPVANVAAPAIEQVATEIAIAIGGSTEAQFSISFSAGNGLATGAVVTRIASGAIDVQLTGIDAKLAMSTLRSALDDLRAGLQRRRVRIGELTVRPAKSAGR